MTVGVTGTWRRRPGPGEPGHPDQVHQVIISLWQIDDCWRKLSLLFPLPFMRLLLERRLPVASNQVILSLCITGLALSGRYLPHYFIFRQTYQCTMYGWTLLGGYELVSNYQCSIWILDIYIILILWHLQIFLRPWQAQQWQIKSSVHLQLCISIPCEVFIIYVTNRPWIC